jgi:hypothetical protein
MSASFPIAARWAFNVVVGVPALNVGGGVAEEFHAGLFVHSCGPHQGGGGSAEGVLPDVVQAGCLQ